MGLKNVVKLYINERVTSQYSHMRCANAVYKITGKSTEKKTDSWTLNNVKLIPATYTPVEPIPLNHQNL